MTGSKRKSCVADKTLGSAKKEGSVKSPSIGPIEMTKREDEKKRATKSLIFSKRSFKKSLSFPFSDGKDALKPSLLMAFIMSFSERESAS